MKYITSFQLFESINLGYPLYHGNRKGDFPPKKRRFAGAIFLTTNLEFAKNFAGFDERDIFSEGAVWEVKIKDSTNLCDPTENSVMQELDLRSIIQKMIDDNYMDPDNGRKFSSNRGKGYKGFDYDKGIEFEIEDPSQSVYNYLWLIKNGAWQIIECAPIIREIKRSGYDGFVVEERGAKNVAIFDENSIEEFEKIL